MEDEPPRSQSAIEKAGISGVAVHLVAARCIIPFVVSLAYPLYELVVRGASPEYYLYTYLPLVGSILSIVGTFFYVRTLQSRSRSPLLFLGVCCGYVPYLFGLYIVGFMGIYQFCTAISPLAPGSLVAGIVWALLGYRALYWTWELSEIGVNHIPTELVSRLQTW